MNENEISRLRDLEIRALELGISIDVCQYDGLDAVAAELSKIIDEENSKLEA